MRNLQDIKIIILTRGAQNSLRSRVKEMALYQYLQPLDVLPDPSGRMSSSVRLSVFATSGRPSRPQWTFVLIR